METIIETESLDFLPGSPPIPPFEPEVVVPTDGGFPLTPGEVAPRKSSARINLDSTPFKSCRKACKTLGLEVTLKSLKSGVPSANASLKI